jgi:precorrin-6x reductase
MNIEQKLYYPIIDSILLELKNRFSDDNILILNGISALYPESNNFLHIDSIRPFAAQMSADLSSLCNEIQVLKPMLKDKKLDNIVALYIELLPLKQAFPTVMSLLLVALTIPISSTTCE